jgi:hypothetical protein
MLLAKLTTAITLGTDKIQRLTLELKANQPLIAPNSCENPAWQNQQGVSSPGGNKYPTVSLFFFSVSQ